METLLSGLDFFATGIGVMFTCAIAAAIILLWDWRFSLIGLVMVQFGVTAVALEAERLDPNVMIIQTCVIALCALILALSNAQTPQSPTIRQSGNWQMRLLTLILLYTALRLFDFNYTLPLPGVGSGDALRMTIFFAWLGICALLILSFSDNPLFTAVALLIWCIPIHVLAALLTPLSGIVILIGIVELLLALACSYLVLTESLSAESQPTIASDVTFPTEDRLLLTDGQMRPISEMKALDMPSVPKTEPERATVARPNQPLTNRPMAAKRSTVSATPRPPLNQRESRSLQTSSLQPSSLQPSSLQPNTHDSRQPAQNPSRSDYPQPRSDYPKPNYPQLNYPNPDNPNPTVPNSDIPNPAVPNLGIPQSDQSQPPQRRTTSETPLAKTEPRTGPNHSSESTSPTRPIPQSNLPATAHESILNQLQGANEDQPTQPTRHMSSLSADTLDQKVTDQPVKSERPGTASLSNSSPTDLDGNSPKTRFFKREPKSTPNSAPDKPTPNQQDSKEEK